MLKEKIIRILKGIGPVQSLGRFARNQFMARAGLQPAGVYWWSKSGKRFEVPPNYRLVVPNLSGSFHDVLRCYWEEYGLGQNCLLVSEPIKVAKTMRNCYPSTEFIACDLYAELMGAEADDMPNYKWDICTDPPLELNSCRFDSIICHALLEHVIAPTTAIKNFIVLLKPNGRLYFMTHTPSFQKHSYPRDYVRFHHDYFEDMPAYLGQAHNLQCELIELYSHRGVVCGCYQKGSLKAASETNALVAMFERL